MWLTMFRSDDLRCDMSVGGRLSPEAGVRAGWVCTLTRMLS